MCSMQNVILKFLLFYLFFCLFQGISGLYRGYKSTVLREVTNLISSIEVQKQYALFSKFIWRNRFKKFKREIIITF